MSDVVIKRLKILDDLAKEVNELKERLDGVLLDDPDYGEFLEEEQKVKKERKDKKDKVMDNAMVRALQEEIKEKAREIRENKEILAQELVEFYRENGVMEIVDPDGNVKKMKFSVKLVS